MPILQRGTLNATALVVPDLYVQVVPPQNLVPNGVPTNVVGVVGTASWGPVNTPTIVGTMADYARNFGPIMPRRFDMGTIVATAVQQGAADFRCVRVTDGTDTAAVCPLLPSGGSFAAALTARYSGTLGNQITIDMRAAAQAGAWRLTLSLPGKSPEVFDNIPGTPAAGFWPALVAAVNTGQGPLRGPSQYCVATLGSSTGAPAALSGAYFQGGTDGASAVTPQNLVGFDGLPRRGLYALRGQGCSIIVLADCDDAATWASQAAFGLAEGAYMMLTGPAGDTILPAIAAKQEAGVDSWAAKLMFGDWIYWSDQANGIIRLVSPQGFVAGRLSNLSPEQSSLNKPLYGVIGTQRSGGPGTGQSTTYSTAELAALLGAGIDVIANPQPGGAFWGVRGGHNTSSNAAVQGDNYTRLTNYIAATLAAGMGQYVGQVINAELFRRVRATQMSFLQNLLGQGILGSADGSLPFSVVCDISNNPLSRTSLGYVQSDAQIQYQAINERFLVNVEGGQTVQVSRQTLPTGQIG